MSITLSEPQKTYKNQFHHRKDSGELDVFEAARYFSGSNEIYAFNKSAVSAHQCRTGRRISLDLPMINRISIPSQTTEKPKKEKYKHPISPGGKLTRILNSLFSPKNYRKKKSNPNPNFNSTTQSVKDESESPVWGKKRRSSISHFPSARNIDYSKSVYSSSITSGFQTPPVYAPTRTNAYKDHKPQAVTVKSIASQNEVYDEKRNRSESVWLNEEFKFNNGFEEEIEFGKLNEVDDGGGSDSSSDLFELKSHDLGYCSSDLPVYETTHLDKIKRGTRVSDNPF
ncbi:hypothetical protein LguiA_032561 [Lonicera macranthoides]